MKKEQQEFVAFEPQKVNRFLIEFNSPFVIPTYAVHKMSELKVVCVYDDGWVNWGDLTIEMYETSEIPIASRSEPNLSAVSKGKSSLPVATIWTLAGAISTGQFRPISSLVCSAIAATARETPTP